MFSFPWLPKLARKNVRTVQSRANALIFDPPAIVRAITFHLLDEGAADAIDAESAKVTVQKISERINQFTVSVDEWRAMENVQRLRWLLEQSHIAIYWASFRCVKFVVHH